MYRLLVLLPLAAALAGCPEREADLVDEIGGKPGRIMEKMKGAAERARDQDQDRLDRMDGE